MRSNHSLKRRPALAGREPANDNAVLCDPRITLMTSRRHSDNATVATERFHIGPRPLMIAAFAGVLLVALSGAFLLGLAAVGVFAVAAGAFELVRQHLVRRPLAAEHSARLTVR